MSRLERLLRRCAQGRCLFVASALLVVVAVVALASVSFFLERDRYRERARVATQNVTALLEAKLAGDFRRVDLAIANFAVEYMRDARQGGVSSARLERAVDLLGALFPELESLGVLDHQGVLQQARPFPSGRGGDFSDRTYFTAARENPHRGLIVDGPVAADALFAPGIRNRYDALLCAYHDQALAPFKALHFHDGVNLTLGLPIIRTSPDHGTAFNIAGTGRADPGPTIAAIAMAARMAAARERNCAPAK